MTKDKRTVSLEDRMRRIEDFIEIYQLVSRYGPSVDSLSYDEAANIWTVDGVYEIPGIATYTGHAGIIEMMEGELHQKLVHDGAAHVGSLPQITVDGDTAVATNYQRVYTKADGFEIFRLSSHRWTLKRTEAGWRCVRRVAQLLDGRPDGRELLGQAFVKQAE